MAIGDALSASRHIPLAKELFPLLTKSSTRPYHETDTWTKEIALFMATAGKKKTSCISTIPPTSVQAITIFLVYCIEFRIVLNAFERSFNFHSILCPFT